MVNERVEVDVTVYETEVPVLDERLSFTWFLI